MKLFRIALIIVTALACSVSYAKKKKRYSKSSVSKMNSLGADEDILKRVRAYKSKHRVRVVQKRAVDRNYRFEVGANYGIFAGADPYTDTTAFGAQADFHFNPRWSVGVRYSSFSNSLNAEGQNRSDEVRELIRQGTYAARSQTSLMSIDRPLSSTMGVINWYPLYGKINFFDWKVAQFDVYTLLGAGTMTLDSGETTTMAFGGGFGVWFSQHVSTRLEMTYQTYQDKVYSGPRDQDMMTVTFTFGILI